jgi:hypothetical protein
MILIVHRWHYIYLSIRYAYLTTNFYVINYS